MELQDIVNDCSSLNIDSTRASDNHFHELVFFTKDTDAWNTLLSKHLGEALKPAGQAPSETDLKITENYGAIEDEQTLFFKKSEEHFIMAMLWPWGNGENTTLKLIRIG